jgi:hypothetical protein
MGPGSRFRLSGTTAVDFRFEFQTANYIPAARNARAMHDPFASENRGRRECRALNAPAASHAK